METNRQVSWLVAGRMVGLSGMLVLPMVLARLLEPADFGAYRQLFLLYGTLYALAQLGMAESLYYFLPSDPRRAGRYAANAVFALGGAGLACFVLLVVAARPIAAAVGNPALEPLLPWLGAFLAFMLVSAVLEVTLVARRQHRGAAAAYAGSDLARAAFLLVPVLLFGSIAALLAGAVLFAALRTATALGLLGRAFATELRPQRPTFSRQLGYALPFAAAVGVDTLQAHLHLYLVSNRFDPVTFALYSIACFQIPLVEFLATSAGSVLMVDVGRAGGRDAPRATSLALWNATSERLATLLLPLFAWLLVAGPDVVVLLFSARYAAAGPLFVLASAMILFALVPTDSMLRALADTRALLLLGALRLVAVVGLLLPLLAELGLRGAILATLGAALFTKVLAVDRVRRHLRAPLGSLLPWRALLSIASASAAASLVAVLAGKALATDSPAARLLVSGVAFLIAYVSLGPWSAHARALAHLPLRGARTRSSIR